MKQILIAGQGKSTVSDAIIKSLELKRKDHELYTKEDFKDWTTEQIEASKTAEIVLVWGLNVCKICGEGEAGLDNPCIGKSKAVEVQE